MQILIACLHHPVCTGRWLTRAFRRLGHHVVHGGGYPNEAAKAHEHRWELQGDWNVSFPAWRPDLIIYADTVWQEYRHEVYSDVPHVTVCTCNNVCNMSTTNHDQFFVAHSNSAEWPLNGDRMTWMPCGYDKELHVPSRIPWGKRAYDVAIVGAIDPLRNGYLDAMRDAGLTVLAASGLYYEDYVAAYHNARISLCVNQYLSPMMRYFETAAMGNLVFGQYCADIKELGARGIINIQSPADAVQMAQYYLNRPHLAKNQIALSMQWVQGHSWDVRAQQIIEWYKEQGNE